MYYFIFFPSKWHNFSARSFPSCKCYPAVVIEGVRLLFRIAKWAYVLIKLTHKQFAYEFFFQLYLLCDFEIMFVTEGVNLIIRSAKWAYLLRKLTHNQLTCELLFQLYRLEQYENCLEVYTDLIKNTSVSRLQVLCSHCIVVPQGSTEISFSL